MPLLPRRSQLAIPLTLAAALATTALLVRRSARRAERRHPPTGRFVHLRNLRLHYFDQGAGQPVVLLHGNGATAQDFLATPLFTQLAQRYRVIAFDRPGFGYSDRPRSRLWTPHAQASLLLDAFDQLHIHSPVILAHSLATLVALALAVQNPHALRGLLLVSGYYYPTPRLDVPLLSLPAIPLLGDLLRYTLSPLLGRLLVPRQVRHIFAPQPVPPAFWAHVPLSIILRPWHLRAAAADTAFMIPAAASLSKHYPHLRLPITLIAGADDQIVNPHTHSTRLHHTLPHTHLHLLPHTGHMPHHPHPTLLLSAIDDLVTSTAPRATPTTPIPAPATP